MSSYLDATFRPRAAQPGEVTLLVPDLWNPGETLPVHVKKDQLVKVWMAIASTMDVGQMVQQQQAQNPYASTW